MTYNQIVSETQMCDISAATGCVLGTDYFPLYVAYSVLPNVWDPNFATTTSMAGEMDAKVNAGVWANL